MTGEDALRSGVGCQADSTDLGPSRDLPIEPADSARAHLGLASVLPRGSPTSVDATPGPGIPSGSFRRGIAALLGGPASDILLVTVTATAAETERQARPGYSTDADIDEAVAPDPAYVRRTFSRPSRLSATTSPGSSPAPSTSGSISPSTPSWRVSWLAPRGFDPSLPPNRSPPATALSRALGEALGGDDRSPGRRRASDPAQMAV